MNRPTSLLTIALLALVYLFARAQTAVASPLAGFVAEFTTEITLEPSPPTGEYATYVHTVKRGENLNQIARRYGVTLQSILNANKLKSTVVWVGQRLYIVTPPARATRPATPPPAKQTAPNKAVSQSTSPPSGQQTFLPTLLRDQNTNFVNTAGVNVPPIGKAIFVSIGRQRLMMYENGVLLREMVVSTGRAGQATITGNFRVKTKLERPFSHLWNMWLPKWLGIYDVGRYENGFHAVPVTPEGQVLWRENLGTPVSYGCVVTSEADAEILYNWAEIGTLFIIRN